MTVSLTEAEKVVLIIVVRQAYRKQHRAMRSLVEKFGPKADLSSAQLRVAELGSIYRKLGGDPTKITNVKTHHE